MTNDFLPNKGSDIFLFMESLIMVKRKYLNTSWQRPQGVKQGTCPAAQTTRG